MKFEKFKKFKFNFRHLSDDEVSLKCRNIQQILKNLKVFLRNDLLLSFKAFQCMPWYLVIGASNSGKSALLSHSGLAFLGKEKFVQLISPDLLTQGDINCWISQQAVFIDVPGYYLEENKKILTPGRAAWLELLHQIRRYRFSKPINGIILTLDITMLDITDLIIIMRKRLTEVLQRLKQTLPVYIVLTKTDKIQGFSTYFEDLGRQEREETCGIAFPPDISLVHAFTENFTFRFDEFITHLHQRALWRLNQESNLQKRRLIFNFPYQLAGLKENLKKILHELSALHLHTVLRGIYFTSSKQKSDQKFLNFINVSIEKSFNLLSSDNPADNLRDNLENNLLVTSHRETKFDQSFFIPALFEKKILPEAGFAGPLQQETNNYFKEYIKKGVLILSGILLCCVIVIFSHVYRQRTYFLDMANTALKDYKLLVLHDSPTANTANKNLNKLLYELDALEIAKQNVQQANLPWLVRIQLHHHDSLSETITNLYEKALLTQLLSAVKEQLSLQLSNQNIANSTALYGLLKTYLMLCDPAHLDKVYLTEWFNNHSRQFNLINNTAFSVHMRALIALKEKIPFLPPDSSVITQVRAILNALPYSLLSEAIFKNDYLNTQPVIFKFEHKIYNPLALTDNQKNLIIKLVKQTTATLDKAANQSIIEAGEGNWVLGDKAPFNLKLVQIKALQNNLMNISQAQAIDAIQLFLNQFNLKSLSSLKQIAQVLESLTDSAYSPLIQIQQFIQQYTDNNTEHNILFKNFKNMPVSVLMDSLVKLKKILIQPIIDSKDKNKKAFLTAQDIIASNAIQQIFNNIKKTAVTLPMPIKEWYLMLSQRSLELIFQEANIYAAQQWQDQILPLCQKSIVPYFPFNSKSNKEISLETFSAFFNQQGIFSRFINSFIKAFIDTQHAQWQWKNYNGFALSKNNNFLSELERANIIQTLYFNNKNQLSLPLSIRYNKQIYYYHWPLNTDSINLPLSGHKKIILNGKWAIFKLFYQGKLQESSPSDKNTKNYNLILNAGPHETRYYLSAPVISPLIGIDFSHNIMTQFQCPIWQDNFKNYLPY